MKLLLDTHTLIWWDVDPSKLSPTANAAIDDAANEVIFSVVSVWEMALLSLKGRMTLRVALREIVQEFLDDQMQLLPVELEHVLKFESLPTIHKDPFDRILISQALVEGATLVTKDVILAKYPVPTLW